MRGDGRVFLLRNGAAWHPAWFQGRVVDVTGGDVEAAICELG
jgi:hypothetical protein